MSRNKSTKEPTVGAKRALTVALTKQTISTIGSADRKVEKKHPRTFWQFAGHVTKTSIATHNGRLN
jgi:hypothetical protein